MSPSNRQKIRRAARQAIAHWTIVLILSATLTGCLSSEPKIPTPATPAAFSALVKDIAEFRGLTINREIVFAGFARDGDPRDPYLAASHQAVEQALRDIGLLRAGWDLRQVLHDLRRFEPQLRSDGAKLSVTAAPNAVTLGAPFAKTHPGLARELPLVLAAIDALQEQNFQRHGDLDLEDSRLALRAVAAGDALLTAIARANGKAKGNLSAADLEMAGRVALEIDKLALGLPDSLRRQAGFAYRYGSQFVLWALRAGGWPGVNALYASPPQSTAQILHPEKYFIKPEPPLRFFPVALLRRMGVAALVERSVGEQLIRGLLAGALPSKGAEETAAGWRGDRLFAFPENGDLLTAWFSSWRSQRDAVNFQRAYRSALERRRQIRFGSSAENLPGALVGTGADGRGVWLQVNGPVVVLVSGAPAPRVQELAVEAWQDLEIDSGTPALSLDLAIGKNH